MRSFGLEAAEVPPDHHPGALALRESARKATVMTRMSRMSWRDQKATCCSIALSFLGNGAPGFKNGPPSAGVLTAALPTL